MRVGINGNRLVASGDLALVIEHIKKAAEDGFPSYWLAQHPAGGLDALTTLALAARVAPEIELCSGVIPSWPRHPVALAAQASTTQQSLGGRLTLSIGLSHKAMLEQGLSIPFEKPIRHMREYLDILVPLLQGKSVSVQGEMLGAEAAFPAVGPPTPVLVGALGPQMLRLAGERADGTILAWTGPKTVREHVAPRIRAAAERVGRSAPRIAAIYSVCVTDDAERARGLVDGWFSGHGDVPSYAKMMALEGVSRPGEIAVVGNEAEVRSRLLEIAESGVTDLCAGEIGANPEEEVRGRVLLKSLTPELC
ncbi:MAG: LLM class F420-dependent oxidoreductase [Deltaproteobacteria bacterium]|nr:LLM class F420-dependent oxidoreductase [Deltaproteobacteria bacterium]